MNELKKWTLLAGICYLVIVLTGILSLMYIPNQLIEWKDPEATFSNISTHLGLFRWGIVASIICYLAYLILPLLLYKILSPVNKKVALIMVILVGVSIPITMINLSNKLDIVDLLTNPVLGSLYSKEEMIKEVFFLLNKYESGITMASLFWGLWLMPFGYLVFKSGFLPKLLGILLMLGCLGYCINIFGSILIQDYGKLGISKWVSLPASLGEIGICLGMLIFGSRKNK